jgi:hypothetical protein
MRHQSTGRRLAKPLALAVVTLLGLALILCLIHTEADKDGLDMLHGSCGVALVASLFAAGLIFVPVNWWLLATLSAPAYAVPLHLPDPPPKSLRLL